MSVTEMPVFALGSLLSLSLCFLSSAFGDLFSRLLKAVNRDRNINLDAEVFGAGTKDH